LIFNLFLFGDEEFLYELGVATHDVQGDDLSKLESLRASIDEDHRIANRYALTPAVKWTEHYKSVRMGRELNIFEDIFIKLNAPKIPLVIVTPIIDGIPRVDLVRIVSEPNPIWVEEDLEGQTSVSIDWLAKYTDNQALDLPRLFDDDYFKAIRLLTNAGHVVSAAKLLMSFIDTVAFLDLGDVPGNFQTWLERFAKLDSIGITPRELWEFRNGLLHMTNINSRAVARGDVPPLILFMGGAGGFRRPNGPRGEKYFNFKALLEVIADAVANWIGTYNVDPDKLPILVERYDLVISDSRTFKVRA
jgi:hypothetical protein